MQSERVIGVTELKGNPTFLIGLIMKTKDSEILILIDTLKGYEELDDYDMKYLIKRLKTVRKKVKKDYTNNKNGLKYQIIKLLNKLFNIVKYSVVFLTSPIWVMPVMTYHYFTNN